MGLFCIKVKFNSLNHLTPPNSMKIPSSKILLSATITLLSLACSKDDIIQSSIEAKESVNEKDRTINRQGRVRLENYNYLPDHLIALTYDDGPGNATVKLTKYLYDQHISATFFVTGDHNTSFPPETSGGYVHYPYLDSLVKYKHRIGNHTYNHLDLNTATCSTILNQLVPNQEVINGVIKNNISYFRAPHGLVTQDVVTCMQGEPKLDILRGQILWNFDTEDYSNRENSNPTAWAQTRYASLDATYFSNSTGGILLMHDYNNYTESDFAYQETVVFVEGTPPYSTVTGLKNRGYIFVAPTLEFSPVISNMTHSGDFSDSNWASSIGYYGTIRLADVSGDGQADVVGRYANGIMVAKASSSGLGFDAATYWTSDFSDAQGWSPAEYSTTLQCADVDGDGDSDIMMRYSDGVWVALSNGSGFGTKTRWTTQFSDTPDQNWDSDIGYYGTMRLADVDKDKKADLIGRGASGIYVAKSTGTGFSPATLWTEQFSDLPSQNFKPAQFSTTIQCADVDDDGDADIIARGSSGVYVAKSTGSSFETATLWTSSFSDAAGYGSNISYYGTIRCGDVNGDHRADLIVRGADGIHVLLSNGSSFIHDTVWIDYDFNNIGGWLSPYYSTTIQCNDINGDGRADIIGRGNSGIKGALAP